MTKEQCAAAIKVIKKDATGRLEYYRPHYRPQSGGDACVIGGLALAAGVKPERLIRDNTVAIIFSDLDDVAEAIKVKFGLDRMELAGLQEINDETPDLIERRKRLIERLKTL